MAYNLVLVIFSINWKQKLIEKLEKEGLTESMVQQAYLELFLQWSGSSTGDGETYSSNLAKR